MRSVRAVLGVVLAATWGVNPAIASATPLTPISGNWTSYLHNPYEVSLDMWGLNRPNTSLQSSVDMLVSSSDFPNDTTLHWDVTPDPHFQGQVNGYLMLAYGNYNENAFPLPGGPRQVKNIAAMTIGADWVYEGDPATGLLSETFLTSTGHASGNNAQNSVAEVGFASKVSAGDVEWAHSLPTVGTFADPDGVTWTVKVRIDPPSAPFYYAYREGPVDHEGMLDFKSYFTFLVGAGKLTGDEYFNGVAYGVEPVSGAASLTINRFTLGYA